MTEISLYKRHKIVYTDPVSGKFNRIRLISMFFIAFTFFLFPWITYSGKQAILFDLSCIRFYFFGKIFWPQDFIIFSVMFITAVFLLFFVTVYAGRLWCGFLCPQSIWIKIAVYFSRVIEGDRIKRKKLDESSLNLSYLKKKFLKNLIWIVFSFITSFTFVSYFIPVNFLIKSLLEFDLRYWSFFWILFFSILTYINISWFREQFCFIVCPYSRLQGAMFDENTLIVTYDQKIGEKRGHRNKQSDYKKLGLGQCIDCYQCVNCCPTGIDIRNGLQMECIGCAACIDACDNVMEKMNYPKGLIRFASENSLNKLEKKRNFRLFAYFSILIFLFSLLIYLFDNRPLLQFNVTRGQTQLYNVIDANTVENFYTLKITNKTSSDDMYKINVLESNIKYFGIERLNIKSEETVFLSVKLILNKTGNENKFNNVTFKVESFNSNNHVLKKSKFIIPA